MLGRKGRGGQPSAATSFELRKGTKSLHSRVEPYICWILDDTERFDRLVDEWENDTESSARWEGRGRRKGQDISEGTSTSSELLPSQQL